MSEDTRPLIFRVIKAPASDLLCSDVDKTVLINFLDAMDPPRNGQLAWPGADTIADRWGWNERTVRRSIDRLCENGLLKLHQRTGRVNVYVVNVGFIHRLVEDGHRVRSEKDDRTESPVRSDRESGQGGRKVRSERAQSPAKSQGRTKETPTSPIPSFGSSETPEVVDPIQRRFALVQMASQAAEGMRLPDSEEPTGEKARESVRALAAGMRTVKERPG